MATLSQSRKAEIAKELRIASSWVGGSRSVRLKNLAAEIEGTDDDSPDTPGRKDEPKKNG